MLNQIEEKNIITLDAARTEYPKTKKLFVVTDMEDVSKIMGYIFMVSPDSSSFKELCDEDTKLQEKGWKTVIIGSYENGGAVGVQYELSK